MKKLFLVANWKSNKTSVEAEEWLQKIQSSNEKEVIICPPFTLLATMRSFVDDKNLPIKLGGQNVSPFDAGAYTGEINAKQIKEFAEYVIIGHSERRNNFGETDEVLSTKVKRAIAAGLTPIFCIQNETTRVPEDATLVAYEPPTAIGTGNADTPGNADRVAKIVKEKYPYVTSILYGGSVTQDNIHSFVEMENISGVLVGGASLDPLKFTALIKNA
jgi:triosephosphate isomerase